MTLRKQAETAAARRLERLKGKAIFRTSPAGYTSEPDRNLISGIVREDFWDDLQGGDGDELVEKNGRAPKYRDLKRCGK